MTSPLKAENETIDRTKFCPDCGQSLEYLGGDGLIERSGQCEVCAGEVECDRLNADREHERNMANEWLAKAHDAGKEVATLKADLSARMSQLNEARAATVEANMALADANERAAAANERADANLRLRMDVLATYVSKEREACALLVEASAGLLGGLKTIAAAIRSRKS